MIISVKEVKLIYLLLLVQLYPHGLNAMRPHRDTERAIIVTPVFSGPKIHLEERPIFVPAYFGKNAPISVNDRKKLGDLEKTNSTAYNFANAIIFLSYAENDPAIPAKETELEELFTSNPEAIKPAFDFMRKTDYWKSHESILRSITKLSKDEISSALLEHYLAGRHFINTKLHLGATALHKFAQSGKTNCMMQAIRARADINCQTHSGLTPLHYAIHGKSESAAKLLIEKKAKLDLVDGFSKTALCAACHIGYMPCIEALIANNANPALVDGTQQTPLHFAAMRSHGDAVRLLLDHKVSPNIGNWANETALHTITQGSRNTAIAQQLLESGANINAKNNYGCTPLDYINSIIKICSDDASEQVRQSMQDFRAFLIANGATGSDKHEHPLRKGICFTNHSINLN